ncbi:ribonuclease H1 [Brevipalpus obovatus]|uniref:ribonuclease H1 n=1 Tax=Brevipalpus obovatus TaxID=246614 RepID=UPI003D9E66FD
MSTRLLCSKLTSLRLFSSSTHAIKPKLASLPSGSVENKQSSFENSTNDHSSDDGDSQIIYVDGSCMGHGLPDSKAGIGIFWGPDDPRNRGLRLDRTTSNRVELHAARYAIRQARSLGLKSVTIRSDSLYLCNAINHWMPRWEKAGWKLSNNKPAKNIDLLVEIQDQMKEIEVKLEWVRGHSDDVFNQRAHELAQFGASCPISDPIEDKFGKERA